MRDPASIPVTLVQTPADLDDFGRALAAASAVAIDTETPIAGPSRGRMRVLSAAVRSSGGGERAFVVDARDLPPARLAPLLQGVTAIAWNANFDARVVDQAVWNSSDVTRGLRWWDAQIADALLHQGQSGFTWYHGLAWATEHYLGVVAEGKGTIQLSYTATDDLTADQIAYAAADAVETLWVGDVIRERIAEAGLGEICVIEMAARPFLDSMERTGLPFDWAGWQAELQALGEQHRAAIGRIAELTGGGQGNLFDSVIEPSWNPASDKQVKNALNRWCPDQVAAYTHARFSIARPLDDADSVSASVLAEIGGPLCEALLEFRDYAKVITTYGESLGEHVGADGRMRPQYLQVVGTNTGRLASRAPNAQNFTPRMKPYVRPPDPGRVFVHADLSQAELRFLAQVADDESLRGAFARGEDVHVTTAATMFGFDADRLLRDDPDRYKRLRQIAKALNFGIAYGTGAAALARSLTANGAPTTLDEGRELLAQYRRTYPGTAAWAERRIAEIESVASKTQHIDWALTMRLAHWHSSVATARRSFRRNHDRWPTHDETVEAVLGPAGDRSEAAVADIAFATRYSAPVALLDDATPFVFVSRTVAGRRQQFNVHLERVFLLAAVEAVGSTESDLISVRLAFEHEHGVDLGRGGASMSNNEVARVFEDRALRRRYVEAIIHQLGLDRARPLLARAARERVRAMVNAWRNAPIQGGVADIMLDGYARLFDALHKYPTARAVQTVHDSVVVECDRTDAVAVASAIRDCLETASRRFCPDVVPSVDVDLRASLADADIIKVI